MKNLRIWFFVGVGNLVCRTEKVNWL